MVAIVSGNSLGLGLSSWATLGQRGSFGSAAQGTSGEQAYVNIANGNLVLQRTDEHLAAAGQSLNAVRTYNSAGLLNEDNADNWSLGAYNQPLRLDGPLNSAASTITRTASDGAQAIYRFDTTRQLYLSTDGAGAHDTIAWDSASSQYLWSDGSSGIQERYEGNADAKLLSRSDPSGNATTYSYDANGLLTSATSASGETTHYDYSGNNLSQIRITNQGGAITSTRVRYTYDTNNRLSSVTVDLSPEDSSTADGKTYQTSYTYDDSQGISRRVASVVQTDGSRLDISYTLVDGAYRVASVRDGLNQSTTYSYDTLSRQTTVTDPLNVASRYSYDAQGQLTQVQTGITAAKPYGLSQLYYAYDAQGNVSAITDGLGHSITLQYDANGNQTLKIDPLGNTVASTYDSRNQLLTETISGAGLSLTTRYIYDAQGKNQLRYSISAEGRVTEHRYNGDGLRVRSIEYAAASYGLSALSTTQAPSEAQMQSWAGAQDLSTSLRSDFSYDFRGQLATRTIYGALDAAGNGTVAAITQYIFSQAGELLQTIDANQNAATVHVYDGLGRVVSSSGPSSDGVTLNTTITDYQDTLARTSVTLANGLSTVSTYDTVGRLLSVMQSSAGTTLGTTYYEYDQNNRLVMVQDSTGVRQWIRYDEAGRKVADVDGTGAATEYRYNANNQITQTIAYATKLGTPVAAAPTLATIHALAGSEDRKNWRIYDSAQRLVWQIDAQGFVTQTDYDSASRIVAVTQLATPVNTSVLGDASSLVVNNSVLSTAGIPEQSATAVSMQVSSARIAVGASVTLNAMVFGNDPQGSVSFYDGTALLGSATLVSGAASLVLSNLTLGTHNISVRYSGNAAHVASTSAAVTTTVVASTNVSLSPLPTSVAQGMNVAFTATVTGASPGGTVTFFDGTTLLGSASVQMVNGLATAVLNLSTLGLGSHAITAAYSGDAANSVATSASSASVRVAAPSTIALSSSQGSAIAGALLTLTAAVGTPAGQTTGSVAFYDGSTLIGTATLAGGVATLATSALALGVRALSAVYTGDDNIAASTSASLGQVVLPPQATTTVLTPSYVQLATGGSLTLNVLVQAVGTGGSTLTGSVTFYDGATNLGTASVVNGVASFTVASVGAGAHAYRVQYVGDSDDAASSSASVGVTAVAGGPNIAAPNGAPTPLVLSGSASSVAQGTSVTLMATLGASDATGAVSFVRGGQLLGTANVVHGVATLVVSALALGGQSVQASYSGNASHLASVSAQALALNVTMAPTSFALSSSVASAVKSNAVVLTAQLTGGMSVFPPSGSVTFYNGAVVLGTATLSNGIAALSVSTLPTGLNNITVEYAGDANNAAGTSAVLSQTITPPPASVSLSASSASVVVGAPITLTANLGTSVTGTVTFLNGQTVLGTAVIVDGVASFTTNALPMGATNITAVYAGDANNTTTTSTTTSISVVYPTPTGSETSVALSISASPVAAGTPLTLSANVASSPTVVGIGVSASGGKVTKTAGGYYTFDASLRSTVGYSGGASVTFQPSPNGGSAMIGLNTDPTTNDSFNTIDWAIYISGGSTLTAYKNGNYLSDLGTYASTDTLSVAYDGVYIKYLKNGVVLYQETATVTQPLYLDSSFSDLGMSVNNVEFKSATGVSLPLNTTGPSGTVTFYSGQACLGTANVVNGVASLTTNALNRTGAANIMAVFGGDGYYASSTSAASVVAVINGSGIGLTTSSTNVAAGTPVTLTANLDVSTNVVGIGATVLGGTVTKTTPSSGAYWDSSLRSIVGYSGGASVSFAPQQESSNFAVGLTTDPNTNNNYDSIDWAIKCTASGSMFACENGSETAIGNFAVGDVLSVAYDGSFLRYFKNGVALHTVAATITQPLFLDSSFQLQGKVISNLQFGNGSGYLPLRTAAPSGTVTFFRGQTILGSASVVNGAANLVTSALSYNGMASITAVYNGDANNAPIVSTPVPINVSGGTSAPSSPANSIVLSTSSATVPVGNAITFNANVSSTPTVVTTGVSVSGNTITKTSGSNYGFDASIRSAVGFIGGASVSFSPPIYGGSVFLGLSTNPSADNGPGSIDWAIYVPPGDDMVVYKNGTYVASLGPWDSSNDVLSVAYDGAYVRYLKNGQVLYQEAATITQPLYLDSSFSDLGMILSNLQFKNAAGTALPLSATGPSGVVTFFDGAARLGTANVINGVASLTISLRAAGNASITAVYGGDGYNPAAVSAARAVAVTGGINLSTSSNNVTAGSPVTLTANLAGLNTVQSQGSAWALTGVSAVGNTITRTAGTTAWGDASIRSIVGYTGGASVSFVPQQDYRQFMIGLNTDPATNASYDSLDWAIYCAGSGVLQAYQNGGMIAELGTYSTGDTLAVTYDGTYIRYLKNGVVLRQEATTITQPLYMDSTWKDANAQVSNLQFSKTSAITNKVSFFNGTTLLGTANVVNGAASLTTSALTANGAANITAVFSGDAYNTALISNTAPINVSGTAGTGAATTTTLSASTPNSTRADSVTLTANVTRTAGGAVPTGTATFFNGATFLGAVELVNGVASFSAIGLPLGGNSLKAVYSGDAQAASSISSVVTETVAKASATASVFASVSSRTSGNATVLLTARVSGANPAGSFTFYNNGVALGGAVTIVNGIATLSTTVALGAASFSAQYAGDASNTSASSSATALALTAPSSVSVLAPTPASVVYGSPVTFSASAPYSASSPGTITFYAGSQLIGIATVQSNGSATLVARNIPVGTHAITAAYSGNASFDAASQASGHSVTVSGIATSTALAVSRSHTPYGASVSLNATITTTSGGWAAGIGGTVSFYKGSSLLGMASVSNGVASLTLSEMDVGASEVTAVYNGDSSGAGYAASMSAVAGATVLASPSSVTLSTSAASAAAGSPITLSAQVSGASPGGSVTFTNGATVLGSATLVNGVATLQVSSLPAGTHQLRASYAGDPHNGTSSSGALTQTVVDLPASTLTRTSAASIAQNASIAITVAGSNPTGTVTLLNGNAVVATATLVNGVATFSASQLPAGSLTLTASYSADASHPASVLQFAQTVTASLASGAVNLAATPTRTAQGLGLMLSARIDGDSANSAIQPTGSVSFYSGAGILLGSASLTYGLGAITLAAPLPALGQVYAVYSGDAANAASTSASLAVQTGSPLLNPSYSTQDRTISQVYGADGLLRASVNGEGYLTEYQYDAAGRLVGTVRYAQPVSGFAGAASIATQLAAARQSGSLSGLLPGVHADDAHTRFFYDARGQRVGELDAEGYLTQNTYDANGNLTQTTRYARRASVQPQNVTAATRLADLIPAAHAEDRSTLRSYDALNRVVQETNPESTVATYSYDSVGNLTKTVQAAGTADARTLATRFDVQGRLVGELTPQGAALLVAGQTQTQIDAIWSQYGLTHAYDTAGRRTSTTDQNGHKTLFFYDADGRLTHTVNALGEVTQNQYNAFGQLSAQVQYGTRIALTGLTGANAGGLVNAALTSAINAVKDGAKDSKTSYSYNTTGTLALSTDALGFNKNYVYNAFGQETSRVLNFGSGPVFGGSAPSSLTQTTSYDRRGLLLGTIADPSGIHAQTQVQYDAFGRVTTSTDANGNTSTASYDRLGRQVSQTDPLTHTRTSAYDAFDRILTQTDALGHTTRYTYDQDARSIVVTTPEGISVTTRSTRLGQTLSVTDGNGNTSSYEYDKNGNRTVEQSPLTRTSASYDRAGRLISTTDANNNVVQLDYDAAGRILTRTLDPAGLNLVTRYTYSPRGEQLSVTDARGTVTQFTYNLKGELTAQAVDPAGLNLVTQYSYDGRGSTLTVTDPTGTVTAYSYDALGRRVQQVVDPTGLALTTQYSYDDNGNLTRRVVLQEHTQNYAYDHVTRYAYDANNRLIFTLVDASDRNDTVQLQVGDNATRVNVGNLQENVYDAEGRLVLTKAYASLISTAGLAATPSEAEIRARIVNASNDLVQRNVYDQDGRLTISVNGTGDVRTYQYDGNGNVIKTTAYTNRVAVPAGNWTEYSVVPVPAANAQDEAIRTVYDGLNRARYTIDATGAMTEQRYDGNGNGNVTERIAYATRLNLVAQPLAANPTEGDLLWRVANIVNAAKDLHTRNVYDAANRVMRSLNSAGQSFSYLYDANGNLLQQTQHATAVASLSDMPVVSANDRFSRNEYDTANRLARSADAAGLVSDYRYDKNGNLTQFKQYAKPLDASYLGQPTGTWLVTLPAPTATPGADRVTRQVYDRAGRSAFSVDAEGAVIGTVRNALGLVTDSTRYNRALNADQLAQLDAQLLASDAVSTTTLSGYLVPNAENDRTTYTRYDAAGRAHLVVDGQDHATRHSYDGAGRLVQTVRFDTVFSAAGLATFFKAANAAIDQVDGFAYDAAGNLVASTDAMGKTEAFTFDGMSRKTSFTNKKNATWDYAYDGAGHLVRETSPEVPVVALNEVNGKLLLNTEQSYPRRVVTLLDYDAQGNLIKRTEAAGLSEQRETSYEYDALGRQVKVIYPTIKVYNAAADNLNATGAATRVELDKTPTSETFYDALGNAVANRDIADNWSYKTYDKAGRVKHEIDALSYATGYTRNAWGEVEVLTRYAQALAAIPAATIAGVAPSAVAVQDTVNANTHVQDRELRTTYDRNGRSLTVAESPVFGYDSSAAVGAQFIDRKITKNTYNTFGELKRVAVLRNPNTSNWVTTSYYFDRMGRQTHILDAMGYLTTQEFDEAGNLVRRTEYANATGIPAEGQKPTPTLNAAKDRTTVNGYDLLNRKTSEERLNVQYTDPTAIANSTAAHQSGSVITSYAYDALGNLVVTADALGATTYTYYDALGRISAVVSPKRYIVQTNGDGATTQAAPVSEYWHDALGNTVATNEHAIGTTVATETSYTSPAQSANDRVTWTRYDSLGHVTQTTDATNHNHYNSYDVRGQLRKSWETVATGGTTLTLFKVFEYDKLGNKTAEVLPLDTTAGASTSRTQMQYNAFGEMTQRGNSALAGVETFEYDNAGRVWRTNTGDGAYKIYLYDLLGNQTAELRSAGKTDEVTEFLGIDLKTGYGTAQAALAASYVQPEKFRRTDLVYDALGRVTQQVAAARVEALDQQVVIHKNTLSASIVPGNKVQLQWPDMTNLGAGEMKIELSYTSSQMTGQSEANGPEYNDIPQPMYAVYASAEEAARGYIVNISTGAYVGAIVQIDQVKVYKKDFNGEWKPVYTGTRTAEQSRTALTWTQPTTLDVGFPIDIVSNTVVEIRPYGTTGDGGWVQLGIDRQKAFGSAYRFDLSQYDAVPGNYEYRLSTTARDGINRRIGTGRFDTLAGTVTPRPGIENLPPLPTTVAPAVDIINGEIHQVLRWQTPPAGVGVTIMRRPLGSTPWINAPWTMYSAGDGHCDAPAGTQEVAIDIHGAGTYEYELRFTYPANGSTPTYTAHAVGSYTVQPTIMPALTPASSTNTVPPVPGMQKSVVNITGILFNVIQWTQPSNAAVSFRFRPLSGGSWTTRTTGDQIFSSGDGQSAFPPGAQGTPLNMAPGDYEFELLVTELAVWGPGEPQLLAKSMGTFTAPTPVSVVDQTYFQNTTTGYTNQGVAGYVWQEPGAGRVALHRWINTNTGRHFYTTDNDLASVAQLEGWGFAREVSPGYVETQPSASNVRLYRLNLQWTDKHVYTTDPAEVQAYLTSGEEWVVEPYYYYVSKQSVSGTQALYRFYSAAYQDHVYTADTYERDYNLGVNSAANPPIYPQGGGNSFFNGVSQGAAVINGISYQVLQWPSPEAGARVRVYVRNAWGNQWEVPVFSQGDGQLSLIAGDNQQCVPMNVGNGAFTYQFVVEYPVTDQHSARLAYATKVVTVNNPDSAFTNTTPPYTAAITGLLTGADIIDGNIHQTLFWPQPEAGTQVSIRMRGAGTSGWYVPAPNVYTLGDGRSSPPAGYQEAPIAIYGPGNFEYELTFTHADGSKAQATGTVTIHPGQTVTHADTTPTYMVGSQFDSAWISSAGTRPVVQATHDRWGNVLQINDPRLSWEGGQWRTTYEYNANNQLIKQILPQDISEGNAETEFYYDKLGHQVGQRDARRDQNSPSGNVNLQEYDTAGNVIKQRNADGGETTINYDAFGDKIRSKVKLTNERSVTTLFEYDKLSRLTQTTLERALTNWTYSLSDTVNYVNGNQNNPTDVGTNGDMSNGAIGIGSESNFIESNQYDEAGRKIATTTGAGITRYSYDRVGNMLQSARPASLATSASYDALNRKISETDGNGHTQTWSFDYFGRLIDHQDFQLNAQGQASAFSFSYTYDQASQLVAQSNTIGQNLRYTYDGAGQLVKIEDKYLGQTSRYTYDLGGKRLSERMSQQTKLANGTQVEVTYQNNHMAYDSQGRLRVATDGNAYVEISYDKAGNRTRVKTSVINRVMGSDGVWREQPIAETQKDQAYTYDAMNRQTSGEGHGYGYDLAGNRVTDSIYAAAGVDAHTDTMTYDDLGRLDSVKRDGVDYEMRRYDAAGRMVYAKSHSSQSGVEPWESWTDYRYNIYDAKGQVAQARVVGRYARVADATVRQMDDVRYNGLAANGAQLGYDEAGNLRGYEATHRQYPYSDTERNTTVTTTAYQYGHNGGYLQTQANTHRAYRGAGNLYSGAPAPDQIVTGTTQSWFDANGYLSNTQQPDANYNRTFVNDAQGRAVYVNQGADSSLVNAAIAGRIQNPGHYLGGSIGTQANPGHVQRQMIVNGEVLARYGEAADQPGNAGQTPTYEGVADFMLGATPIPMRGQGSDPVSYTVAGGESLKDIARVVLGDERLWYVIAEANGLAGDTDLTTGQTLTIPQRPLSVNGADTFRPYDPSKATGSLDPALPQLPQPGDKGCGAIGQIIMIVVAVVVTVLTAGAAAAAMSTAAASLSASAAAAGGLSGALAGAAAAMGAVGGSLVGVAAGALGAAVGSIASQAVGMAIGAQDSFSWKGVALSAIGGGIGAGLGGATPLGGAPTDFGNVVARAAMGNVASQGIGVVTGLQDKFSWRSVAASAVGAGVGQAVGGELGKAWGGTPMGDFAARAVTGVAAGTAAAVMRGGKIAIQQVAVDAFGNALGSSLADASAGVQTQGEGPWSDRDYVNGSDLQSDQAAMQRQREVLYGFNTGNNGLGLTAGGGYGLSAGGMRATGDTSLSSTAGAAGDALQAIYDERHPPLGGPVLVADNSNASVWEILQARGRNNPMSVFNKDPSTPGGFIGSAGRDLTSPIGFLADAKSRTLSVLGAQMQDMQTLSKNPNASLLERMSANLTLGQMAQNYALVDSGAPTSFLDVALTALGAKPVVGGLYGELKVGATATYSVGIPATRSTNPLSPVLEFDAHGNEITYRTMSRQQFEQLQETNRLPPTGETSTAAAIDYSSSNYRGVTVRLTTMPGTSAQLQEIGIAAPGKATAAQFPDMSTKSGPWVQTNARFKVEGGQTTTQLGQGKALEIFNKNLIQFELVPKK